jgi:hypothetical protein
MKAVITSKYIKQGQYESKLFKVLESEKNDVLSKMVKSWDNESFLYIKEKVLLGQDLEINKYYKMKLYFDSFTTDEGKDITYIRGVKYKEVDFHEKSAPMDCMSDDDF